MILYELTRWWNYRRIKHPSMAWYIWRIPGAAASLTAVTYILLPERPGVASPDGLISGVSQIMTILPGFFIAALAAVATFNREEMDDPMPAPTPTTTIFRQGEWIEVVLTRRLFLTYLFSYLSILSLGTSIVCLALKLAHPSAVYLFKNIYDPSWRSWLKDISEFSLALILFYICASILVTTLHGIYFLTERMHQPH